jgi:hypothetical protein
MPFVWVNSSVGEAFNTILFNFLNTALAFIT